jgi:hypothetical protein
MEKASPKQSLNGVVPVPDAFVVKVPISATQAQEAGEVPVVDIVHDVFAEKVAVTVNALPFELFPGILKFTVCPFVKGALNVCVCVPPLFVTVTVSVPVVGAFW